MRRSQDSLNARTHADIMVRAQEEGEDTHPYWYGRIIGIFHVYVQHKSIPGGVKQIDFLWVRWLGRDINFAGGWKTKRLHRIGFVDDETAFGFLDPDQVIRGAHLIPAFAHGRTNALLTGKSVARAGNEEGKDDDWNFFYVAM